MSANPHWEVSLARSQDLQNIGELRYPFSLSPTFNRSGTLSMTMPLDDRIAYSVAKHATCVVCERNDEVRWSGPIVSVVRDPAAMTLSITALGWLDELFHRYVRADEEQSLIFSGVAGGVIVATLIAFANVQTDTDGVVRPTHLSFASATDTQVRTRAYKRGQNYGQAIQELSDIENGLDLYVDPQSRLISTRPPDAYRDRTGVLFGFGVEPFNLANASQNDDGTTTANRISAVSSGGVVVPVDDVNAIVAQDTMREDWISLSDVAEATIVGAYAASEVIYRSRGQITYDVAMRPYGDVPRLWDDFEFGDKVYLSIDAGALQVDNQAIRIFSATVEVDAQGNESITQITTSPA